jgi:hypothetical protein
MANSMHTSIRVADWIVPLYSIYTMGVHGLVPSKTRIKLPARCIGRLSTCAALFNLVFVVEMLLLILMLLTTGSFLYALRKSSKSTVN